MPIRVFNIDDERNIGRVVRGEPIGDARRARDSPVAAGAPREPADVEGGASGP